VNENGMSTSTSLYPCELLNHCSSWVNHKSASDYRATL